MASAASLLAVSTSAPIPPILFGGEYCLYHEFAMALYDYIAALRTGAYDGAHEPASFWLRWRLISPSQPRLWKCFCSRFVEVDDDLSVNRSYFSLHEDRIPEAERLLDCIQGRLIEYYTDWKRSAGAAGPTREDDDEAYKPHPIGTAVIDGIRELRAQDTYARLAKRLDALYALQEWNEFDRNRFGPNIDWRIMSVCLTNVHTVYYEGGLKTPPAHAALVQLIGNLMTRAVLTGRADLGLPGAPSCAWITTGAFPDRDVRFRARMIMSDAIRKVDNALGTQRRRNAAVVDQALASYDGKLADDVVNYIKSKTSEDAERAYALVHDPHRGKRPASPAAGADHRRRRADAEPAAPAAPVMPTTRQRLDDLAARAPLHRAHEVDMQNPVVARMRFNPDALSEFLSG